MRVAWFLPKTGLQDLVDALSSFGPVAAPVRKGSGHVYDFVSSAEEIDFNFTRTKLPPKKFLLPYRRVVGIYTPESMDYASVGKDEKVVLLGVHPCDLHGIEVLTRFFPEVRERALLVGVSCIPDEHCFCLDSGSAFVESAFFDLFLAPLDEGFLLFVGSTKGWEAVEKLVGLIREATEEEILLYSEVLKKRTELLRRKTLPLAGVSLLLEALYQSQMWEELSKGCLGCGTCTNVCPTCFCFASYDVPDIEGTKVKRVEFATSCQYPVHSRVAGGHYFRPSLADRFKHRYYHKLVGYTRQVGRIGCVGCGRCSFFCPAGIRMEEVLERLLYDQGVNHGH